MKGFCVQLLQGLLLVVVGYSISRIAFVNWKTCNFNRLMARLQHKRCFSNVGIEQDFQSVQEHIIHRTSEYYMLNPSPFVPDTSLADLTLRQQDFYSVVDAARAHLAHLPTKRVFGFGHLADGNCHLVATADSFDPAIESHLYPWLYEWVSSRGGSISSEHGVGFAKRMYTPLAHSTDALRLMQQLKQNMDPTGILNPYKLIPPRKWFY